VTISIHLVQTVPHQGHDDPNIQIFALNLDNIPVPHSYNLSMPLTYTHHTHIHTSHTHTHTHTHIHTYTLTNLSTPLLNLPRHVNMNYLANRRLDNSKDDAGLRNGFYR